jgi:Domain of unknown function (DUF5655)
MDAITPEDFFAGSPDGLAVFARVKDLIDKAAPDATVRVSKSQVAFRRRRGFAYLWRPGQYVRNPGAEVVLSIALARQVGSARFKQVIQPAPSVWMHHMEIRSLEDLDGEIAAWLREAADDAGPQRRR